MRRLDAWRVKPVRGPPRFAAPPVDNPARLAAYRGLSAGGPRVLGERGTARAYYKADIQQHIPALIRLARENPAAATAYARKIRDLRVLRAQGVLPPERIGPRRPRAPRAASLRRVPRVTTPPAAMVVPPRAPRHTTFSPAGGAPAAAAAAAPLPPSPPGWSLVSPSLFALPQRVPLLPTPPTVFRRRAPPVAPMDAARLPTPIEMRALPAELRLRSGGALLRSASPLSPRAPRGLRLPTLKKRARK